MDQEQANNQRFFLKDNLVDPQVRRNFLTRPPTGSYFSPTLSSDCFAIDFSERVIIPSEELRIARAKRVEGTSATFHRLRLEAPAEPLSA